jgi:RNA polymerase sigma-70 factor (ECF subfamily)
MATQEEAQDPNHPCAGPRAGAEDLVLARRALAGDSDARSELARRLVCVVRMLTALNARWGRPLSAHDLEDITQDVIVALWRGLPSFSGLSSLESWVFRSCHRALLARLRRSARGRAVSDSEALEHLAPVQTPTNDDVYQALERLEPRARSVIELKHFEELTFEEIGARLSTSPNTIKSWYYQTIADLRRILGPGRRGGGA